MSSTITPLTAAVLNGVHEAVFVFDPAGRLIYANAAAERMLGDGGPGRGRDAHQLLPVLAGRGGRVVPLWSNGSKLGEAAFVPATEPTAAKTLAEGEREAILATLNATGWRLTETARRLGISRTTLWRRLNAYGLERPPR